MSAIERPQGDRMRRTGRWLIGSVICCEETSHTPVDLKRAIRIISPALLAPIEECYVNQLKVVVARDVIIVMRGETVVRVISRAVWESNRMRYETLLSLLTG
jgi:hypothetical protein